MLAVDSYVSWCSRTVSDISSLLRLEKLKCFVFKVRRCGLKMQVIGVSALYYAAYLKAVAPWAANPHLHPRFAKPIRL